MNPSRSAEPWKQRVLHRDVTVLSVREPGVLDEIRATVNIDEFVLAVISDTQLLIDPARTGDLNERLAAAGMAPLVQKARGSVHHDK